MFLQSLPPTPLVSLAFTTGKKSRLLEGIEVIVITGFTFLSACIINILVCLDKS